MGEVNISEIKQYNAEYKRYQQLAANTRAEITVNNREIDRLCSELSEELGVTVTRDNVEQIYNERVAKINNDLQIGREILNRIKMEEQQANAQAQLVSQIAQGANAGQTVQGVQSQPYMQAQQMAQVQQAQTIPGAVNIPMGSIPGYAGQTVPVQQYGAGQVVGQQVGVGMNNDQMAQAWDSLGSVPPVVGAAQPTMNIPPLFAPHNQPLGGGSTDGNVDGI